MRTFCDLRERPIGLGRCLGRGGEGAVYSVPMSTRLVAKLYARRPDAETARKLALMVQLGTPALAQFAAWPQDLLLDPKTGETLGFLMPRVDGHREIHTLYGPADRRTAFPDASWAFLARAARNVAAAFDAVHAHGHVIGDVNQGNVVVSRQATVRLIDCDSFQISHLGQTYPCRVGVPLFTPPELQGQRLEHVVRTPDHDRFGLAVLVFQLLFMGRHPFTGRHAQRALPVEAAIREGLFVFGPDAPRLGWVPPPFSLGLRDVPDLAPLFARAFSKEAAAGAPRPGAAQWVEALDALEARMVPCDDDPRHVHARAGGTCPWCQIENEGGPSFFFLPQGSAPDAFDLDAAWRTIETVKSPGPAPVPVLPEEARPATAAPSPLPGPLRRMLAFLAGPDEQTRLEEARRAAEEAATVEEIRRLANQWRALCGDQAFVAHRRELDAARAALQALAGLEEKERAELRERCHEPLLQEHLRGFVLEHARLPGLGPAELAGLASSGITTAADVTPQRLMAIRGIDLELVRTLLLYKANATRSFAPEPDAGIPGREQKALDDRQSRRREALLRTLQTGALQLAERRRQALVWRDELGHALADARRRLAELRNPPRGVEGTSRLDLT